MGRFCACFAKLATCFCFTSKDKTDHLDQDDQRNVDQVLNGPSVCFANNIDPNGRILPNSPILVTVNNNNYKENNNLAKSPYLSCSGKDPQHTGVKLECTSGARKETTLIHWKVQDFMALCELKELLRNETCLFTAGQTINKPTRWCFNLQRMKNEDNIGLFLKRLQPVTFKDVIGYSQGGGGGDIKNNAVINKSINDGRGDLVPHVHTLSNLLGGDEDADESVYIHYECVIKRSGYGENWLHKRTCIPNFDINSRLGFRKLFTMEDFKAANESLKQKIPPLLSEDNSLHLEIKFTIYLKSIEITRSEINLRETFSLEFADRYHTGLLREELKDLFVSGMNADLILLIESEHADERTFLAHKGVLAARSPVFRGLLQSGMKETTSGIVRIKDVTPTAMENVLSYIYCGTIDDKFNWNNVQEVQNLIYAADKYCLSGLRNFCDKMLFTGCENGNAMDLLYLAQLHSLNVAVKEISLYIKMNANEIFSAST